MPNGNVVYNEVEPAIEEQPVDETALEEPVIEEQPVDEPAIEEPPLKSRRRKDACAR